MRGEETERRNGVSVGGGREWRAATGRRWRVAGRTLRKEGNWSNGSDRCAGFLVLKKSKSRLRAHRGRQSGSVFMRRLRSRAMAAGARALLTTTTRRGARAT